MSISATHDPPCIRAVAVWAKDDLLFVRLEDGREVGVPVAWFPRLAHATPEELGRTRLLGRGLVISWPDLDEDLAVEGFLSPGVSASPVPHEARVPASA